MDISDSKDFIVSTASLKEVRVFSREVFEKINIQQEQKDEFGDVLSWTFASHNMGAVLKVIAPKAKNGIFFSDYTGYRNINARIFSMCPNYLQTVNLKYFVVNEIEPDLKNITNLPGRDHPDVV